MELTLIKGIGLQRAAILEESGIDSIEKLAALTFEELAIIIPSSSVKWIKEAKSLVVTAETAEEKLPEVKLTYPCPNCGSSNIMRRAEAAEPRLHLRCLDCGKAFAINKYTGERL